MTGCRIYSRTYSFPCDSCCYWATFNAQYGSSWFCFIYWKVCAVNGIRDTSRWLCSTPTIAFSYRAVITVPVVPYLTSPDSKQIFGTRNCMFSTSHFNCQGSVVWVVHSSRESFVYLLCIWIAAAAAATVNLRNSWRKIKSCCYVNFQHFRCVSSLQTSGIFITWNVFCVCWICLRKGKWPSWVCVHAQVCVKIVLLSLRETCPSEKCHHHVRSAHC